MARDEDEALEPLCVTPLAMEGPILEEGNQEAAREISTSTPFEWVTMKEKIFGTYLGASYKGYEEKVTHLLMAIDARRNSQGGGPIVRKRVAVLGMKGSKELKGLVSSINYDTREDKQRKTSKGGHLMLT